MYWLSRRLATAPCTRSAAVSTLVADLRAESGQTMAEYAVVLGVITIAVVVTLRLLSTGIKNTLSNVITAL
jgi:Flp pilus assembly pilin Flp